jgi:nicotinate phosphoribosyltransferase
MPQAKIMASGDLDEKRIRALLDAGAPIDAFGVGTELAVSGDAPSMGTIYKLVEIERDGKARPTAKNSPDKRTLPGAKQLFRYPEHDLLGLHDECAGGAEAMLKPYIIGGNLIRPLAPLERIRQRARVAMTPWPATNRRTELSPALQDLNERVHESVLRY